MMVSTRLMLPELSSHNERFAMGCDPEPSCSWSADQVLGKSHVPEHSGRYSATKSTYSEIESDRSQTPSSSSRVVGRLFAMEDFDHVEMLGEGFFSKVSKVRHRGSEEVLVLKVLKTTPTANRRVVHLDVAREAALMRTLIHPNVLQWKGHCIENNETGWELHLLVDFCEGGSLSNKILDRLQYFPWRERLRYAADIASAMEYIHRSGYLHRDLTSMNVLLKSVPVGNDAYSRAVVADFGLSCRIPTPGEKLQQVGTTYFMSPECLKEEFYDEMSDVFSFGVITCQLIARVGVDPDGGLPRTSHFGLDYVLFTPCCPPDTPLELLKIAFNCCLLNPDSRPSFQTVHKQLERLFVSTPHQMPSSLDLLKDGRLGRSRSDAALKRRQTGIVGVACRKLSNNATITPFMQPVIEGIADEQSVVEAMESLARDVAREEPMHDHVNPFIKHKRYRMERKIVPRRSGRRRSETKPETGTNIQETIPLSTINSPRRRWSSLPCEIDAVNEVFDGEFEEADCPGQMPIEYREYDMIFARERKRFPARRHTMGPHSADAGLDIRHQKSSSVDGVLTTTERLQITSILWETVEEVQPQHHTKSSLDVNETINKRAGDVEDGQTRTDDVLPLHRSIEPGQYSPATGDRLNNNPISTTKAPPFLPTSDALVVEEGDVVDTLAEDPYAGLVCNVSSSCAAQTHRHRDKCIIL